MLPEQLGASTERLVLTLVAGAGVYLWVIVLTRLAGLRSLAKMSSFDFAATVAVGSTVASTATGSVPLSVGALTLAVLFGMQYGIATLRRRNLLGGAVDNRPMLLMAGTRVLEDNMAHARVSREELWSQLRLAGVHSLEQVHAVVLETSGDVSVLRAGEQIDDELLAGIRDAEALRG